MARTVILVSVLVVALLGAVVETAAQEATPGASPAALEAIDVVLRDVDGRDVGIATFAETPDGRVSIGVSVEALTPGEHGIHVHETGVCDPTGDRAFASAGGHYNPTGAQHGRHAGDLGNITAAAAGTATFLEATDAFDLEELRDGDGASIVIHAEEDANDPAGESFGARIACGVLAAPAGDATPDA